MMYCRKCGKKIDENSRFCSFCGTRIDDAAVNSVTGTKKISGKTVFIRGLAVVLGVGIIAGSGYAVARTPEIRKKLGMGPESKAEEVLPMKEEEKTSFSAMPEEEDKENKKENKNVEPDTHSVFSDMPKKGFFTSGVGAWQTELQLEEDGSFTGQFADTDLGISEPDYPNGTVFICRFEGKFSVPEKVGDYTYKTRLVEWETEGNAGEEYIEGGYKYIYTDAYGLNGKEYILYEPGISTHELPEELVGWMSILSEDTEILSYYVLYNVEEQTPFFFM